MHQVMNLENELKRHFEEDRTNFQRMDEQFSKIQAAADQQTEQLNTILLHIKTTNEFMENLDGFNNLVKGTTLLKKPVLWFLAIVLGIVALFGGLKTILSWFLITK
jgi:hypothetical protein